MKRNDKEYSDNVLQDCIRQIQASVKDYRAKYLSLYSSKGEETHTFPNTPDFEQGLLTGKIFALDDIITMLIKHLSGWRNE